MVSAVGTHRRKNHLSALTNTFLFFLFLFMFFFFFALLSGEEGCMTSLKMAAKETV